MLRKIGRTLQFFALVLLPTTMILDLTGNLGRHFLLNDMVWLLLIGVACFVVGWLIQRPAPR